MTNETRALILKTTQETIKVFIVFSILIAIVSKGQLACVAGFFVGTMISILNFCLLSSAIDNLINKLSRSMLSPIIRFIIRFFFMGLAVYYSVKHKSTINLYTLILGFVMVQLSMAINEIKSLKK